MIENLGLLQDELREVSRKLDQLIALHGTTLANDKDKAQAMAGDTAPAVMSSHVPFLLLDQWAMVMQPVTQQRFDRVMGPALQHLSVEPDRVMAILLEAIALYGSATKSMHPADARHQTLERFAETLGKWVELAGQPLRDPATGDPTQRFLTRTLPEWKPRA